MSGTIQRDTLGRTVRRGSRIAVGQRYSRWTVVARVVPTTGKTKWRCRCRCGTERVLHGHSLLSGKSSSCGCYHKENQRQRMSERNTSHGCAVRGAETPEYKTWCDMRARCERGHQKEHIYAARGIKVCERWESFKAFHEDMGPRPSPDHSIDRIDNDGNYEPGNCRWATRSEQGRNRRTNRLLTVGSETRPLAEWAEISGINDAALRARLRQGWTPERAVRTPLGG